MSSSDKIKDALIAAFPGTSAKDWKRRSKTKVGASTERVFANAISGDEVATMEDAAGNVTVAGMQIATAVSASPSVTPPKAASKAAPKSQPKTSVVPEGMLAGTALRAALVPGSTWKILSDIEVTRWVNDYDHSTRQSTQRLMPVGRIAAGAEFVVAAKKMMSKYWSSGEEEQSDGYLQPLAFKVADDLTVYEGGAEQLRSWHDYKGDFFGYDRSVKPQVVDIPIKQLEGKMIALEIPETPFFVLRDTATNEYFGGWKMEDYAIKHGPQYAHVGMRQTDERKMVTKLSSAKKYSTESACKASIRDFIGYNAGLEDYHGGESGPEYMEGGKKKMDLPPTWEMVSFDKSSGRELRIIDVQNWLRELMRLRNLTAKFGTAVRAVYKKAEGKGYDSIVVFSSRSRGRTLEGKSYDEVTPFDYQHDRTIVPQIEAAAKNISGKSLKAKAEAHIAYAVNRTDAFTLQLGFSHPDVEIIVYDYETLEEVVS